MNNLELELENIDGVKLSEAIPYTLIENYIYDIEGLSATKKLFLLMMRRYAGSDQKPAFPSYHKLLSTIGGNSRKTISKCISFFEWLKWIEKINRADLKTKQKISNYYILNLKNIRIVLEHFNKKNISFKEVEKYFDEQYKNKETKEKMLNTDCKYLKE
jgi:hypothetical protein